MVEKHGCEVVNVSSTSYAFAITWSNGSVTTIGNPDRGGNSSHVQGLLTSVQLVRSNLRAFAAVTSHRNVVCWSDPESGGRVEAIPACGIVDIRSTSGAIKCTGELVTWGCPQSGGALCLPLYSVVVQATKYTFASLHEGSFLHLWGQHF